VARIEPLSAHLGQTRLSQLYGLPDLDRVPKIALPTAELQALFVKRLLAVFTMCASDRRQNWPWRLTPKALKPIRKLDLSQLRNVLSGKLHGRPPHLRHQRLRQQLG
jgi:hypothetical protein